jgi:hypothetical protein
VKIYLLEGYNLGCNVPYFRQSDVSGQHTVSTFKAEEQAKLETSRCRRSSKQWRRYGGLSPTIRCHNAESRISQSRRENRKRQTYLFLLRFIQDASCSDYMTSDANQVFCHIELFDSDSTHSDSNSPIRSHFHINIILNHPSSQQYRLPHVQIPSNTICTEPRSAYTFHSTEILQHGMTLDMCNNVIQQCDYLCWAEIYLKWENYLYLSGCLN